MKRQAMLTNKPKYLCFLIVVYTAMLMSSNWFDLRFIRIFGFVSTGGVLLFPLTCLLIDLITEVYGYKQARKTIWCAFFFNMIFVFYQLLVTQFSSLEYSSYRSVLNNALLFDIRIILSAIASSFIAELINAYILAKLKIKMQGSYIGIRFILSTICSSFTYSVIFIILAFYHLINNDQLIKLLLTTAWLRLFIELLGLPFVTRLAIRLKYLELLDIYDSHTKFNLLRLESDYQSEDNLM